MALSRRLSVAHQSPGECARCDDQYDAIRAAFELELADMLENQLDDGEWEDDELAVHGVHSVVEMLREVHGQQRSHDQ